MSRHIQGLCSDDHLAAATDLVMVRMGTDAVSVCCKGPWACLMARLVRVYNSLHPVRARGSNDGMGKTWRQHEMNYGREGLVGWN